MFRENFTKYELDKFGLVRLPEVYVTDEQRKRYNIPPKATNKETLELLTKKGWEEKKPEVNQFRIKEYEDQIKFELDIVEELGFTDYFLLVWMVINKMRELGAFIDFGRGCLNGDCAVLTKNGYKQLRDIKIGDYVLTKNKKFEKVLNSLSYDCKEKLVKIKSWAGDADSPAMTEDHKVACIKNPFLNLKSQSYKRPTVTGISEAEIFSHFSAEKIEWVQAKDIVPGDYVVRATESDEFLKSNLDDIDLAFFSNDIKVEFDFVYETKCANNYFPKRTLKYPRFIKQDKDFLFMLGFFIGDGWIKTEGSEIGFAFNSETDLESYQKIKIYWETLGFECRENKSKKKKLIQFVVKSRLIKKFFLSLVPEKARFKQIPPAYIFLNDTLSEALLEGLIKSDGSRTKKSTLFCYDSINPLLIYQIRFISERLGFRSGIQRRKMPSNDGFKIQVYGNTKKKFYKTIQKDGYLFKKVISKTYIENPENKVYDLTIENEPSYQTGDLLVHNSCAASTVFWILGVTGVDPIEKELIFSRFISKVRAKKQTINGATYLQGDLSPDVDINLGGVRDEIVAWLREIYPGKMCKIATVGTLTGKILIKDTYKINEGVSENEAKEIADLVEKSFGIVEDIEEMPAKNKKFADWAEKHRETYEIALQLRGLIRQKGCHPSGYVISYYPLEGFLPLSSNKDGDLITSYEMNDVCNFVIKLDLLGLISNEVINNVLKEINEKITTKILDNDPLIYDQFQNRTLLPYGLYQISADCGFRVVNEIKAKNIFELSDCNAIGRPGALDYLKGYVKNDSPSPHKLFDKILRKTRNHCLYQESMMQLLMAVGFTADEAEVCRRIVGKKKVNEVKAWQQKIYDKIKENNLPENLGDILWKILDDSSKYSFNFSHSLSTSYLSAMTVYLKYKYPLKFFKACLNTVKHLPSPMDEISAIEKELPYFGLKLLPPHLLKSDMEFKEEDGNLRFGLAYLKGIADKALEKLINFRKPHANKFEIFLSAKESGINISVLSSLICSGCLDENEQTNRPRLLAEAHLWNLLSDNEKKYALHFAEEFKYDLIELVKGLKNKINDKGKPVIKESRYDTLRRKFEPYWAMYNHNKKNVDLCKYFFEKDILGYSYSIQLINIYQKYCGDLSTIKEVKEKFDDNQWVHFAAEVTDVVEGTAKNEKKTKYLKCMVKDNTASLAAMLFNENIGNHYEENPKGVREGDIVMIKGKKYKDSISCTRISVQDTQIFLKIKQMKDKIKKEESQIVSETISKPILLDKSEPLLELNNQ